MALLRIDGGELTVQLSKVEKVEAFHGDITLPLGAVTDVQAVDDPWPHLRGIRAPGTGIPAVIAVGTRRGGFGKDFVAVHGKGPAVVVELSGADYARVVVTDDDAVAVAATIRSALGEAPPTP
jgi:hypothetical protein